LEAAYGKESSQVSVARRLLDKAVQRVFDKTRDTYRGGVVSEIVLTHKLGVSGGGEHGDHDHHGRDLVKNRVFWCPSTDNLHPVFLPSCHLQLSTATRRLQTSDDDDNTPPSLEKIASVNLLTWTSVGLVLVLLLAINVICSADSGPKDSLLYAKFQADTSGNKND